MKAYLNIVDNGKRLEKTDILEGTGNSRLVYLNSVLSGNVLSIKNYRAAVCLINACKQVEGGGFSCAVRADKTVKLTLFNSHIKVVYRL